MNAVKRETNPPSHEELKHAYHIAGESFVGMLKEYFILLDDDAAKKKPNSAGGAKSDKQKGKRRASGDVPSDTKKKVPATQ